MLPLYMGRHVVVMAEEQTCVGCLFISVWCPEPRFRWFHLCFMSFETNHRNNCYIISTRT